MWRDPEFIPISKVRLTCLSVIFIWNIQFHSLHLILSAQTFKEVAVHSDVKIYPRIFQRHSSLKQNLTTKSWGIYKHTPYSNRKFGSPVAQTVKHLPTMRETGVQSLRQEDPLEKEMATHSSILAWKIPRMEEPGGLQSMRPQRVGHDWTISISLLEGKLPLRKICTEKWA